MTGMTYRHLGRTGLKVSVLSFGCWVTFGNQVGVKEAKLLLKSCIEHGVNFIDNAEVYAAGQAEVIMGQAIQQLIEEKVIHKRSDLVLSTKIFWGGQGVNDRGLSRKHIIEGTQASLKRMGMDYVDLIFCHRPDPSTPIEETVRAMNHVIERGWAFYWGTSEWSAAQIEEACEIATRLNLIGPSMEQPQYNLLHREKVESEFLHLYKSIGLGTTIWSPLASGVLTGKYTRETIPEGSRLALQDYKGLRDQKLVDDVLGRVKRLKVLAEELGVSPAQLAIAWCIKNPNVSTVITGATKVSQIEENMKALEVVPRLTAEIMQSINDIVTAQAMSQ